MAIPLEVLVSWSKTGKSDNSKITYDAIKTVIENNLGYNYDIFLQGSYHNTTHVKDNSDIDVVVVNKSLTINNTLYGLYGDLNSLHNFKRGLYYHIQNANNFNFALGNKTIKYSGNSYYVPADIVPCGYYKGAQYGAPVGTILYDTNLGKYFINYPRQHYDNGTLKSSLTNDNFKKTVRMFKNARNYAVKKNILSSEDIAPSYFLECLIYNVPNTAFLGNESNIFFNVLKWLCDNRQNLANLKCQNGIQNLFGYDVSNVTYNKWNTSDAISFIDNITYIWNNWGLV